jgi:membrane associated rhomboid family serine protease
MAFKGIALILSGLCIVIFLLQVTISGLTNFLVLNDGSWLQPWRFVTALFAHGSLVHLLYNILALALFGSMLESVVGARKLIAIFLGVGIFANLVAIFVYPLSLGASGAIFGVIGTLVMLRPGMAVFAFGLPMPLFIAAIVWAAGDVIGLFVPSDVGNAAHLVGLLTGILIGATLRRHFSSIKRKQRHIYLDEQMMRRWEKHNLH